MKPPKTNLVYKGSYIGIRLRCPISGKDTRYVVAENAKVIRCKCCERWHNLNMLKQLRTEVFAPRFKDGPVHPGYEGAICIEEAFGDPDFDRQLLP